MPRTTRAPIDLVATAGLTIAAIVAALADAPQAIQAPLGLLLILALPGYAWLSVTHPGQGPEPEEGDPERHRVRGLGWGDRLALVVPTSLAIDVLLGLVLVYLPVGLTLTSAAVAIGLATALGVGIGLAVRLADTPPDRRPTFTALPLAGRPWHELASFVLVLVALGGLAVAGVAFLRQASDEGYVSLYLDPNHRVECYPLRFANGTYAYGGPASSCPGTPEDIDVVVNNHLGSPLTATLRTGWSLDPDPEAPIDLLVAEEALRLEPADEEEGLGLARQSARALAPGEPPYPGLQYLKVQLFIGDADVPQHALQLRVDAGAASG